MGGFPAEFLERISCAGITLAVLSWEAQEKAKRLRREIIENSSDERNSGLDRTTEMSGLSDRVA
jgi:hypothetical protein